MKVYESRMMAHLYPLYLCKKAVKAMENVNFVTMVNTTQNKVHRICRTESTATLHGKI